MGVDSNRVGVDSNRVGGRGWIVIGWEGGGGWWS